jgi:hypothetical protein
MSTLTFFSIFSSPSPRQRPQINLPVLNLENYHSFLTSVLKERLPSSYMNHFSLAVKLRKLGYKRKLTKNVGGYIIQIRATENIFLLISVTFRLVWRERWDPVSIALILQQGRFMEREREREREENRLSFF